MSDEHVKLVAKIQHFYDVMMRRLSEMEEDNLTSVNELESLSYREKSVELNFLSFEFSKTFENFLYKDPKCKVKMIIQD